MISDVGDPELPIGRRGWAGANPGTGREKSRRSARRSGVGAGRAVALGACGRSRPGTDRLALGDEDAAPS